VPRRVCNPGCANCVPDRQNAGTAAARENVCIYACGLSMPEDVPPRRALWHHAFAPAQRLSFPQTFRTSMAVFLSLPLMPKLPKSFSLSPQMPRGLVSPHRGRSCTPALRGIVFPSLLPSAGGHPGFSSEQWACGGAAARTGLAAGMRKQSTPAAEPRALPPGHLPSGTQA